MILNFVCYWSGMRFKKSIYVLPALLSLSACLEEKTTVEEVNDLVERCLEFVETSDFPSRSLYWVRHTQSPTYRNSDSSLLVQYFGTDIENLFCGITNYEATWEKSDRDAVFDLMVQRGAKWVASADELHVKDISASDTSTNEYQRYVLFRSSREGGAYLAVHEERETNIVSILIGRGGINR